MLTKQYSGDQIENEIGGSCSNVVVRRSVYNILVGNNEGKRPLGRPRRRWENNIKMDLHEVVCEHELD
jgi:hypothetical protein